MKSPGNVNGFNLFFVELSSYEVIDFAKISQSITYLPECDPLTLNFATAGYDSIFIIPSLGLTYYVILGFFALVLVYLALQPVAKKCGGRVRKARNAIGKRLFWNATIRFFVEAYLQFAMQALLNLKTMQSYDGLGNLYYNNVFAIMMAIAVVVLPIVLISIYLIKRESWEDEDF